jgi:hypothetical protein
MLSSTLTFVLATRSHAGNLLAIYRAPAVIESHFSIGNLLACWQLAGHLSATCCKPCILSAT